MALGLKVEGATLHTQKKQAYLARKAAERRAKAESDQAAGKVGCHVVQTVMA